jgi:type IV pilus assembly protein PilM
VDLSQGRPGKTMILKSAPNVATLRDRILKVNAVQRLIQWIDSMPRPPIAVEISSDRISAVRFSRGGSVVSFAVEPLAEGMVVPSPVGANIVDSAGVRSAMSRACSRIHAAGEYAALLLPDPVIRVFVQQFDEFPRASQEAIPLLRWRLKKSLPFEMTDTVLSYVRQASREGGVGVVTTIARLRVIREYEELVESAGLHPGVVLSSSLAALALLEKQGPTLIARVADRSLTTAIIREGALCGYRCTELPVRGEQLSPQALFEEIYPLAAYYHDAWHEKIESVCISGVGNRFPEFAGPIESEFQCEVQPLLHANPAHSRVAEDGRPLVEAGLDGLVGWIVSLN